MDNASSRPQTATEILMDTQTEIKLLIKQAIFSAYFMMQYDERVRELIDKNLEAIENEQLRETAKETLLRFARQEFQIMVTMFNLGNLPILLAFSQTAKKEVKPQTFQPILDQKIKDLGKIELTRAYSQLGNSQAKVSYSQSLYGHSERVERHEQQVEMVEDCRKKSNLVVCDTHSDCSDRCFPWQGRVYSLDGTYGKTDDGRDYVPLEVATDVYVTTKSGRTWKNGLLGFNCRHNIVPYKTGLKPVNVPESEQQREYTITNKQRFLEREIRKAKDMAFSFGQGANMPQFDKEMQKYSQEKSAFYRNKAKLLTKEYEEFCKKHNRTRYSSRLKI